MPHQILCARLVPAREASLENATSSRDEVEDEDD
jgi:hypothetical protein